jgi:hypothetical protein
VIHWGQRSTTDERSDMSYPPIIDKTVFESIIIASWHDIDIGDSTHIGDYYAEDGRLIFNSREPIVGRETIREGYQTRLAAGARLSRHVVSNVFVVSASENEVKTVSYMRLYAGNGEPPLPHPEPLSVSDEYDTFTRAEDGIWYIAERHLVQRMADPDTVFRTPPSPAATK